MRGTSLGDLVNQAQQDGGVQSQDPAARALAVAAMRKGNLVENLQSAGEGNALDGRIRQIQQQAERTGWTDEARNAVRDMRNFQSGAALDARSLGQLNFNTEGGGGGSFGGGGGGGIVPGDDLMTLAQLIGKFKGSLDYNRQVRTGVGADPNMNAWAQSQSTGPLSVLEPLYAKLMEQKDLETEILKNKAQEARNASQPRIQIGRLGGDDMDMGGGGFGMDRPRMGPPLRAPEQGGGQYDKVRDAALRAALQYLTKQNPHRIGNL